eukprot:2216477-Pleurochrysis_carterae.AAC.1
MGHPQEREFHDTRDITWALVEWKVLAAASVGCLWALVHIVAIKDAEARHRSVPPPVRRRQCYGARGVDPLCVYDALWAAWDAHVDDVPVGERTFGQRSNTPFFTASQWHDTLIDSALAQNSRGAWQRRQASRRTSAAA